jgi:protein ImuB
VLRRRSFGAEAAAHEALLDCARIFSPRVEDTNFRTTSHLESWQLTPKKKQVRRVGQPSTTRSEDTDETTKRHLRMQPAAAAKLSANNGASQQRACGDLVIADLDGLERLFGGTHTIAGSMQLRAREFGLEIRVGIAANPDAAVLAAKGLSGVTVIAQDKEAEILGRLPVEALDPAREVLETFDRWGVRTCRDLAALPQVSLITRLGQEGKRLQTLARGEGNRVLVPCDPPTQFSEQVELEDAVQNLELLHALLTHTMEKLCARLNARALCAQCFELVLELVDADLAAVDPEINVLPPKKPVRNTLRREDGGLEFRRSMSLPVPSNDAKLLSRLLRLDLEMNAPQAAVSKIVLRATPAPPRPGQANLFAIASIEPERMELLLAKLRKIVEAGDTEPRVGCCEVVDTHRREAFLVKPFRPETSGTVASKLPSTVRALRQLRPPVDAKVQCQQRMPRRVVSALITGDVIQSAGPWRSSGTWWRPGEEWAREEWDVSIRSALSGHSLLVLLVSSGGSWRIEATYD